MKEKTYRLLDPRIAANCAEYILNEVPHDGRVMVEIKEAVKLRSLPQNSRYWATLNEELKSLHREIDIISTHTGYSTLEVRRLVAARLPPEQAAVLFTHKPESVHDILKMIHGVSTTTRLGTKVFMQYEERMLQTVAEIVGEVRAVSRESA